MIELLAALSASASAGMRIALPLLVIGLLQSNNLWSNVPLLSQIHPSVLVGILTSWALFELFASQKVAGTTGVANRAADLKPFGRGIMGISVAQLADAPTAFVWLVGIVGSLLAFVLQLVQVGWFFRLRGLPLWVVFTQDVLCIVLVILAFDAPRSGGLIALMLLLLAIRSSQQWHRWYVGGNRQKMRRYPPYEMPD